MKYKAYWSKTYYMSGEVEVEASSKEEAHRLAFDEAQDLEATLRGGEDNLTIDLVELN